MSQLPLILIVEDDDLLQDTYADILKDRFRLLCARTLEEAEKMIARHHESLAAIVMDACVPGSVPNTVPLVRGLRESGFQNPIVAASGEPVSQEALMAAGCGHRCEKREITSLLSRLLD